ncbi:MAG: polyprenyl diphosphate synthase [Gemmatimonadaceae bacterium]
MIQSTLSLPRHVAIIMDGNGRWAQHRGRPRWAGHRAGAVAAREIVEHCAKIGVCQLTLFTFSSDNWSRPRPEVETIFRLCEERLDAECDALARAGVRTTVIGRRDRLPDALRRAIANVESATTNGRRMDLRLAIDYSSRAALAESLGIPRPLRLVSADPGATILPPVDLLVRTGGERRLSDFLLWECAYAELSFLDVLFPDFRPSHLDAVLADYSARDRRFGGLSGREIA